MGADELAVKLIAVFHLVTKHTLFQGRVRLLLFSSFGLLFSSLFTSRSLEPLKKKQKNILN